jgi:predicted DNA-binding protein (MmcQ/YjbR family)
MNIEQLRKFCFALPYVTEDMKWGNDLCFCIGKKMFAVTGIETDNNTVSFKCTPEKFAELVEIEGIIPAHYVARYHWVTVEKPDALGSAELAKLIINSYHLVREKLPKKHRDALV